MFRQPAAGPQPTWKRPLYLVLTTLLGVIMSYGIHAVLELWYLRYLDQHGQFPVWQTHFGMGLSALPVSVQYGLLLVGGFGGWFTGRVWWRWVYVERRWVGHMKHPESPSQ